MNRHIKSRITQSKIFLPRMNHKHQKNWITKKVHYLKNLPCSSQFSKPKSFLYIQVGAWSNNSPINYYFSKVMYIIQLTAIIFLIMTIFYDLKCKGLKVSTCATFHRAPSSCSSLHSSTALSWTLVYEAINVCIVKCWGKAGDHH